MVAPGSRHPSAFPGSGLRSQECQETGLARVASRGQPAGLGKGLAALRSNWLPEASWLMPVPRAQWWPGSLMITSGPWFPLTLNLTDFIAVTSPRPLLSLPLPPCSVSQPQLIRSTGCCLVAPHPVPPATQLCPAPSPRSRTTRGALARLPCPARWLPAGLGLWEASQELRQGEGKREAEGFNLLTPSLGGQLRRALCLRNLASF